MSRFTHTRRFYKILLEANDIGMYYVLFIYLKHHGTKDGSVNVLSQILYGQYRIWELFECYRICTIITRSRFETALDYKPRICRFRKVSCSTKFVLQGTFLNLKMMAAGLSRPGKSRGGPRIGQDLETLKVRGPVVPGRPTR